MWRRSRSTPETPEGVSYLHCPAKTFHNIDGTVTPGRSVLNHCQIVGEVAREIIARFPSGLRDELFPKDSPMAAAGHDIGKVSPYFVEKIRRACTSGTEAIISNSNINPLLEREWGGHAGVSQVTAKSLNAPKYLPEILGQHHGFSPRVDGKRADDEIFGGPAWQQERVALAEDLKTRLNMGWPQVKSVPEARLLAGLTSVADWIGSGEFFENPATPWEDNIGKALDAAGFIPPTYKPGLTFQQIFGFEPRLAQQKLIEQVTNPGVYVLEAPMGLGKTEAALYAAYQLLERQQATGVYFALPTQLTSNKIYDRFNDFLESILPLDCTHRSLLLHSNAALLEHTDMGEEGRPGGAWFNQAKRGLLAPFAVGTVDQALMAAMNVKHGFVRAFGLAGKVVILDEVHTYDAYTGTILDALVLLLRELRCTVIILSATLNRDRREKLLGSELKSDEYPLITAIPRHHPVTELPVAVSNHQKVAIRLTSNDKQTIEEVFERAIQGQQVLWIENTVVEAQTRYLDLAARAAELGLDCGLLHSRFTASDRHRIEHRWVNLYGKQGLPERGRHGRILVGTQVLEQSLDIDADFLVSRFAPTDMLLQRIGRLWRHKDTPRPESAICECWLLTPDIHQAIEQPQQAFGTTAFVYSPYVLCRSLEVWNDKTGLQLPGDIRSLIEQTYLPRNETGSMAKWLQELDNGSSGRNAMQQLARITLADIGNTLPESKAQSRYSETDNFDVLLLRKIALCPDENTTCLTLLNGEKLSLPWHKNKLNKQGWRKLSATLMRQVVGVRVQDSPIALDINTLKKFGFQHCFYLGNPDWPQDESVLRVALVDETGGLLGVQGQPVHGKHHLNYRDDLGYQVIKN